ncbi:hypothetical protein [Nautilia lithotrophica]
MVFGIMFYPLFISSGKNIPHQIKKKTLSLPDVKVEDGEFYIYKKALEKKGKFKILNVYKKGYIAFDLNAKDLLKNEEYKSSKTIFKDDIVTGYKVWYKNKDIELNTKKAIYNKKTDILKGGKFQLFAKDFRGYGNEFFVDDNKNLYAKNITYYLKVEK